VFVLGGGLSWFTTACEMVTNGLFDEWQLLSSCTSLRVVSLPLLLCRAAVR